MPESASLYMTKKNRDETGRKEGKNMKDKNKTTVYNNALLSGDTFRNCMERPSLSQQIVELPWRFHNFLAWLCMQFVRQNHLEGTSISLRQNTGENQ